MTDKTRVFNTPEFFLKYEAEVTVEFREGAHVHIKRLTMEQAATLRDQLSAHLEKEASNG